MWTAQGYCLKAELIKPAEGLDARYWGRGTVHGVEPENLGEWRYWMNWGNERRGQDQAGRTRSPLGTHPV